MWERPATQRQKEIAELRELIGTGKGTNKEEEKLEELLEQEFLDDELKRWRRFPLERKKVLWRLLEQEKAEERS